jgi:thymidylate kinase
MIIEFVGLPGCGKSTLAELVISAMQPNSVILQRKDLTKNMYRMMAHPILIPFYVGYYLVLPKYWRIKKNIIKFAAQYPLNKTRVIVIIHLFWLYEQFQKHFNDNKIFILDEGFIQFVSAIPHSILMKDNGLLKNLINELSSITNDTLFIDCNLDIKENINRLRKRNRQDQFNRLKDDIDLETLLLTKKSNLVLLINKITIKKISIDMSNSLENNASIILKELKKK